MGIGNRIGELLKNQSRTAAWLSRETGIPATTLRSMISRDSDRADIETIGKIAAALGCPVTELISPQEYYSRGMAELQKELKKADEEYIDTLSRPALELNHIGRIALLKAAYSMAADPDYTEPEIKRMLEMWNISIDELTE